MNIHKYSKRQRISLIEQGINGIAELYAQLAERLDDIEQKLEDRAKEQDAMQDVQEDLSRRVEEETIALTELKDGFERCAKHVDELALKARCDYYNRGVLDEYMYGADKEEQTWKKP